jgi:hypothetical protein
MLRTSVAILTLALAAPMLQPAVAAEPLAPATQWVAEDALLVLELSKPDALLDVLLDPKMAEMVQSLPAYRKAAAQPGFRQFLGVISYLEGQLGTEWQDGVRKLLGGGVTFAAGPGETALLIVDSTDAEMLKKLQEIILEFAQQDAKKEGNPDRVASAEYRGVTGWTLGPGQVHAIIGNRLLFANKPEALKAAIDRREDPAMSSLASSANYQAAKKAAGADAVATAYLDLATLKQIPNIKKGLTDETNPLAALLFAGVIDAVRESNWLALGMHVEEETLRIEAAVDGKVVDPTGPAAFAMPAEPGKGALPLFSVPRLVAGMSFYRDLHGFYAAKDELFPERSSGLIFFENMMGIFFTGRDLTEEVLAETEPEVRLVVAGQEYDPAIGKPGMQLPAFALVMQLRNPEKFSVVVEEAWQKALGLINFTRGQQALPGLIIDKPMHGDTKYSIAYFSTSAEDDKENLDTRFNLRPSLAMLDDYLILSSAEGLTRDLIDAAKREVAESVQPLGDVHSVLEIDGRQLASILGVNREHLVRQNMVNEGNTKEQAETEIGVLLAIVEALGKVKLDVGSRDGNTQASLVLELNVAPK